MMFIYLYIVCLFTRVCNAAPKAKRQQTPYNLPVGVSSSSSSQNHMKPPGDMTSFLDQVQQTFSSSNSGSGHVQHQFHGGPAFSSQTGGQLTGGASSGTGQLPGKCNTKITRSCPADCTEIDTVTGCVTCKTNCQSSSQSGVLSTYGGTSGGSSGGTGSLPGKCDTTVVQTCPVDCTEINSMTGCIFCKANCPLTSLISGNGNTNSKFNIVTVSPTQPNAVQNQGTCPPFPSNCPRGGASIQNGCPVCSALMTTTPQPSRTTTLSGTCAPVRCVAPCNKGIFLNSVGCPVCLCS